MSRTRPFIPVKILMFRPLHKRKQICIFSEAHFASLAYLCLFRWTVINEKPQEIEGSRTSNVTPGYIHGMSFVDVYMKWTFRYNVTCLSNLSSCALRNDKPYPLYITDRNSQTYRKKFANLPKKPDRISPPENTKSKWKQNTYLSSVHEYKGWFYGGA